MSGQHNIGSSPNWWTWYRSQHPQRRLATQLIFVHLFRGPGHNFASCGAFRAQHSDDRLPHGYHVRWQRRWIPGRCVEFRDSHRNLGKACCVLSVRSSHRCGCGGAWKHHLGGWRFAQIRPHIRDSLLRDFNLYVESGSGYFYP